MTNLRPCLTETNLPWPNKQVGKVRDTYDLGEFLAIVTTDRQSAFDRILCSVPYKGQVLNLCSAWWFQQTEHIVPNHVVDVPDPNITIAKKCLVFPIEFVVRGYMTGSTSTSIWTQYQQGNRNYCGVSLPDGLKKNDKLTHPILTPTTKADNHDRPISPEAIISEGWMTQAHWQAASEIVMKLFQFGSDIARQKGLILVDTKYELGVDSQGQITLVDEVHTPDSSRYWLAESYEQRHQQGLEPESFDKEFLRLWFMQHCNPYEDDVLPKAPDDLIETLSTRYIHLFETITGQPFQYPLPTDNMNKRMVANLNKYMHVMAL
ncbi:phosphoribosylaminoimidazolesuccinocarboxamide synthase [Legionella sp. W05-934-2]|jgi:phosphoribosylaminoimidazole-succinocarboxamide synthase|uniref:phosphoribosylaminoimidazolesuccinocarboxamide synthase n=1 Tax=Legionella sp. W05-934-2 TaxID=1198649 RepID=UPI003461FB06